MVDPSANRDTAAPGRLLEALRRARVEAAERTAVVVDLRDAELARLDILNEALDSLFAEIPAGAELFERGVSQGDTPRLWIDIVAHVVMGRDKRLYRFVQDTRFGRIVLAESHDAAEIVKAVTSYVARRLVERERALAGLPVPGMPVVSPSSTQQPSSPRAPSRIWAFVLGVAVGAAALFGLALIASLRVF